MRRVLIMVDLTQLDGVGPARSDYLTEAGYGDFETIADADNEELAEDVDIPEDTALELIVQSQNIVAESEAEVEEDEPDTISDELEGELDAEESLDELPDEEEIEEEFEEDTDAGEDEEPVDEDEPITFEVEFEQSLSYDTFFDSVMAQRMNMYRTNRSGVEAYSHALDQMRDGSADEPVTLEMTEDQLNDLHNSVRQMIIDYKGDNLIDHMDALQGVMNQIEEVRSEHLF